MDVRAIVLFGAPEPGPHDQRSESNVTEITVLPTGDAVRSSESAFDVPLAVLPVLGRSVLARTVDRLRQYGVTAVHVFGVEDERFALPAAELKSIGPIAQLPSDRIWKEAEHAFAQMAQDGAELIIVVRLGAYAELDYEELIQFHLFEKARVTRAWSGAIPLDVFVLQAQRRNDAAFLLRSGLRRSRVAAARFFAEAYVNHLRGPADFRRLALDALYCRCALRPVGAELKPGVWQAPHARIHPAARVVAPCYIGEGARVRAGAVITRGSSVERNSVIDCGTVIENSTVLPFSFVGAGLDLVASVVGLNHIHDIAKNVSVELFDPKLLGSISTSAGMRTLAGTAAAAVLLPLQAMRSLFSRNGTAPEPCAADFTAAAMLHPARSGRDLNKMPADLVAVARRYGNQ